VSTNHDEDDLNLLLIRAARAHRVRLGRLLAELGLHPGQEGLLMQLWAQDGQTQAQLAAALGVEAPTITKMVARMEAHGLVARHADDADRRASRVYLTAEGKRLKRPVERAWKKLAEEMTAELSERQQGSLRAGLRSAVHNLQG
jgi:DNA-binding MarR family transcriptional regulator